MKCHCRCHGNFNEVVPGEVRRSGRIFCEHCSAIDSTDPLRATMFEIESWVASNLRDCGSGLVKLADDCYAPRSQLFEAILSYIDAESPPAHERVGMEQALLYLRDAIGAADERKLVRLGDGLVASHVLETAIQRWVDTNKERSPLDDY